MKKEFKVFIAEDNKTFVAAIAKMLDFEGRGYDYRVVDEHGDVMEQINSYRPDLILLDIMMPFADGLEICRAVKKDATLGSTYIIILSGRDSETDIRTGMAAGADDYAVKPFAPSEMMSKIENARSKLKGR